MTRGQCILTWSLPVRGRIDQGKRKNKASPSRKQRTAFVLHRHLKSAKRGKHLPLKQRTAGIARGVAAGDVRPDITAEDLLRTVVGVFYADGSAQWQASALRIIDVFVDGLRQR